MANTIEKSRDHIQYPGIRNKSRSVVADGMNQVAEHGKAYFDRTRPGSKTSIRGILRQACQRVGLG